MKPMRRFNRRSFLARVAGAAAVGGGALAAIAPSRAQTGITDRDPGDRVGNGRGGGTGITDRDTGPGADPAGRGRGLTPPASQGVTDSDPTDPIGRGRGTSLSDRDSGPNADPPGRGRRATQQGIQEEGARVQCQADRNRLAQLEQDVADPTLWSEAQLAEARLNLSRIYSIQNQAAAINARRPQMPPVQYTAEIGALEEQYRLILRANAMGDIPPPPAINELTNRIRIAEQSATRRAERQYGIDQLRRSIRDRNCP